MIAPARSTRQRQQDALTRLAEDVDAWVATADGERGSPYLVPLSYLWDGSALFIAVPASSRTSRNLQGTGKVRIGIGPTRDVILIDGEAQALAAGELPVEVGDTFVVKTGFDPRQLDTPYLYFRITPRRVQSWREANELEGRELMRDGRWLV